MTSIKKLNEMNAITFTVKIETGDPGGDGHGISRDHYFRTNYDISALKAAYQQSVKKFGIDPKYICNDYQCPQIEQDQYEKLEAGGFPIADYFAKDDDYYIHDGADGFVSMVMEFIKASLPDLDYEKIQMRVPSVGSFGYGLHST